MELQINSTPPPQPIQGKKTKISFKMLTPIVSIKKAPKQPKKEYKIREGRKASALDMKYAHIKPVEFNHIFPTEHGSIRQMLNSCHPDVNMFLDSNEIYTIKANCSDLTIVTRNKFTMKIKVTGQYERSIIIKDKKGKIITNTISKSVKEKL